MPDLIEIVGATTNTIEVVGSTSTIAEVVNAGPPGPPGDSIYEDLDALEAATVPAPVIRVYVKSYDAAIGPEGGDWYAETGTEPTHDLWVQDAGGRYWQLDNPAPYAEAGGARGNGSTDDGPAIQRLINYLEAVYDSGGAIHHRSVTYRVATAIRIKTGIVLIGAGGLFGGYGPNSGQPSSPGTTYLLNNSAIDPVLLIQAETFGDYVAGGGILGINFEGSNLGTTAIEARTVSGWTFDIWGEQLTGRLLDINGDNGKISAGIRINRSLFRAGAASTLA